MSRLPKLPWLIRATLGSIPNTRTMPAARTAVSAIWRGLGSKATLVSAMNEAAAVEHERMHGRAFVHLGAQADHLADMAQVGGELADRTGEHGVRLAARQHDR
ncbi:MAG: hypothetical protein U1E17_07835 [Geminicoccaceae bacterium]